MLSGSDLIVSDEITVSFIKAESDFQRRPIAHTCGCVLELPDTYTEFTDLRKDFTEILKSGIWIMDIV